MRTFKNKELYKDVLWRLANGYFLDIEWKRVYNDVINRNMDLDASIRIVFINPRGIGNQIDWAYSQFSKVYHKLITWDNLTKKFKRKAYKI